MAKKNSAPAPTSSAPEGFRRLGSISSARYVAAKTGLTVHADLIGMFQRKNERKPGEMLKFYQAFLLVPCMVREGKGQDAKEVEAEIGDPVNINWNPKTSVLEDLLPSMARGAKYEVFLTYGKKLPISGGRMMWDVDVQVKMTRPESAELEPDFGAQEGDDGSEDGATV
jgi:hypothetical protein